MSKVAVYGSLRQGHGNNAILRRNNAELVCTSTTKKPYAMYSLGGFPFVSLSEPKTPITVEVYEVNDNCMRQLDMLEGYRGDGNQSFYNRSQIEIEGVPESVYIYHIDDRANEVPVQSGDWNEFLREKGYSI